jgi:hypothetical protein
VLSQSLALTKILALPPPTSKLMLLLMKRNLPSRLLLVTPTNQDLVGDARHYDNTENLKGVKDTEFDDVADDDNDNNVGDVGDYDDKKDLEGVEDTQLENVAVDENDNNQETAADVDMELDDKGRVPSN